MSNLVTGSNMPKDLMSVLEKYGVPMKRCTSFMVGCAAPDQLLLISWTGYAEEFLGEPWDTPVIESRTFKLLVVE